MTFLENETMTAPGRTLESVDGGGDSVRNAFAKFPSGVAALCARVDGAPVGIVASSFTVGVSFYPPMVMFSVQNSSTTWPVLRRAERIGVSILGSEHAGICRQLASKTGDRFAGLDVTTTGRGAVLIEGSTVWLECEVLSETPAGDHHVVVLEVQGVSTDHGTEPLVYHAQRFRELTAG